jgi:hypothetical protein
VSNNNGPCTTVDTARTANTLAGSEVTVTATGSVSLLAGVNTGLFGLTLPNITVHGQTSMVVL